MTTKETWTVSPSYCILCDKQSSLSITNLMPSVPFVVNKHSTTMITTAYLRAHHSISTKYLVSKLWLVITDFITDRETDTNVMLECVSFVWEWVTMTSSSEKTMWSNRTMSFSLALFKSGVAFYDWMRKQPWPMEISHVEIVTSN